MILRHLGLRRSTGSASLRPYGAFRRTLIAAPKPGSGPLMSRRADRELPSVNNSRRWLKTVPVFLLVMGLSTAAIFNYQKSSSSVVSSTLYALRTNSQAREILGDEIYFASKFPWISGELNQLHGRIDIKFWVKGRKQKALMRFKSERKYRMGYFQTLVWSLETEDGRVVQLLNSDGADPFAKSNITSV
ncbi:cytochrome oxidase complex assembly protein 1-domain-containing protein [Elsinoe ampelina]|uniref:Cytochrome oxidase complex assembly protein 1-domain-containing protein n=1 Tax=Elsinoe ampelina TaxID=302913 RepID=A0A6A6GCX9_9PEZI|nr:cytochrome oxidase complex assembly protein 1-domain-containing protein [Elsinoe ampelina]